jgi:hypothetical protein
VRNSTKIDQKKQNLLIIDFLVNDIYYRYNFQTPSLSFRRRRNPREKLLVISCWLLVVGCWFLVDQKKQKSINTRFFS